jgi:hypothetical protein
MKSNDAKKTILLFEDNADVLSKLVPKINKCLGVDLELKIFPLDKKPEVETGPFEDRLVAALGANMYSNVVLIVTDRDLSTQQWGGLSEAAVSRAAIELGLPVACYRQVKPVPEERLKRIPGNGRIELPADRDELARKVAILARGFIELEGLVRARVSEKPKAGKKNVSGGSLPHLSPGMLLAEILNNPETASHFDTYACGDQGAIAEILTLSTSKKASFNKREERALIVALGIWLADLVMEYPGVLVNEIAAASYLDIDPTDFKKKTVRAQFTSAEYVALPFADSDQPMWWRHTLDDLLNAEGHTSGLELCKAKGIRQIKFCPCSVDPKLHAGYVCMATNAPLSAEKSSGRVSWFPPGSDLARLTKTTYRKLAPWIGA